MESLVVTGRPLESLTRYLAARSRRELREMVAEPCYEEGQARKKMKRTSDESAPYEQCAKLSKLVGVDDGGVKRIFLRNNIILIENCKNR
uniref:Uncharacterized protein n=1 Tax=Leersia perrieri TaxID=77586 RepID=A0A0D9W807_9ORYZ